MQPGSPCCTREILVAQFFVVGQWQGSAQPRAMLLADGANAIAGDLPTTATVFVAVPAEAGDKFDTNVKGFGALQQVRAELVEQLGAANDRPIVIGGDASVTVGALSSIADRSQVGLVWCSAEPGLVSMATSETGFDRSALGAILGAGEPKLALNPALAPERVVTVGVRNVADTETDQFTALRSAEVTAPETLADAVTQSGATGVWVHVNLDVLDPTEIEGLFSPEPFGVASGDLVAALKSLKSRVPILGATIAGFAPRSADAATNDLGVILRLIGALA